MADSPTLLEVPVEGIHCAACVRRVENAIASHPAVQQVGVVGVPDAKWGEAVHAVVVCATDAVTAAELETHAREAIAGYKVPKTWTLQAEPLPLSAAGKILKRELRERFRSQDR